MTDVHHSSAPTPHEPSHGTDYRFAERITLRPISTDEVELVLAGNSVTKKVPTTELAALLEDTYFRD